MRAMLRVAAGITAGLQQNLALDRTSNLHRMSPSPKSPSWGQLKKSLARMEAAELLHVIRDLHALSTDNRTFLETRFLPRSGEIERYRRRVSEALYPDPFSRKPISIAAARRAIRQYEVAARDPVGVLDLQLTFVEQGTAQAIDLGYGNDRYFASLESMLDAVLLSLRSRLPGVDRDGFGSRLIALRDSGQGLGWGFGDYLSGALRDYG